jgi:serine/threonine protein kinase
MQGRDDVDLTLYNPQSDAAFALNGRYRLDQIVGHGGMGKVFQATDMVLNRQVVVKILLSEYVQEKTFIERFTREAKILSSINHPHLLVIYDYGIYAHKTPYIVTEYVEGRSLAQIVADEGRLQVKRAVNLVSQILDALAATHAHGVIHRDLKADNILVGGAANAEWVKVIDFGLAYQMEHRKVSEAGSRITGSGLFVGTLAYMPPEQFMNENLDARTDLYSVGILLWEMLVGSVPFNAPTLERFYSKHSTEAVPAFASITPPLPPQAMGLEPVILKALAKRPKERWKDAPEFKVALRKAEEKTIRESIPYQAFNIKTDRVPTDRIPYPTTDRLREHEQKLATRETKGKTSFKILAHKQEGGSPRTARATFVRMGMSLRKTSTFILSLVIYFVILTLVAFLAYVGYPKVKGILYPPPHVSLSVSDIKHEGDAVTVLLSGDAEFCLPLKKLLIETTMVDLERRTFPLRADPGHLSKTSDGTYGDVADIALRSQAVPVSHTAYLPLDVFLGTDHTQKFCFRVRIIDGNGDTMRTLFTGPQQLVAGEPSASPPAPAP